MPTQTAPTLQDGEPFLIGEWLVEPTLNRLTRGRVSVQIELKAMDVLLCLVKHSGEVVSKHNILDAVWQTEFVSDTTLQVRIAQLREALGDDAQNPGYIETIRKRGYRLIAEIGAPADTDDVPALPESPSTHEEERIPYPGLAAFTEADADVFFGRESEVAALWRKITSRRLLALIGPSGIGKSSLLRAGVATRAPLGWRVVVFSPGDDPAMSLARALAPDHAGDPAAVSRLVGFNDADNALAVVSRWREHFEEVVLVVDQFEELFTLNPPETQSKFVELLRRLVDAADVHIVLAMRDDFLAQCQRFPKIAPIFDGLTPLGPPGAEALRRAIIEPAARRLHSFESAVLVDRMIAEVEDQRGALPLLAFAIRRLWEKRDREERVLTEAAYESIGGVAGGLALHAEAIMGEIGHERLPIVRELFRNLVTAEGTRAVREVDDLLSVFEGEKVRELESEKVRKSALPSVASEKLRVRGQRPSPLTATEGSGLTPHSSPARDAAAEVLRKLIDVRLLTTFETHDDDNLSTRRVEIVHESLLANWPRLVRWQTQDADAAQLRDQLRQAARTWEDHQRTRDYLWAGKAYREFELWRESYPGGLTELEESFAGAMVKHAKRRTRRRRIGVAASFAVLLAVLVVIGSFWRQSVRDARRAEAQKLIMLGQMELTDTPRNSIPYSLASLELADSEEARLLALEALWQGPPPLVIPQRMGGWGLDFSPDGRQLAVGFHDKQIGVWGSTGEDPTVLQPENPPDDWVTWIRFAAEPGLLFSSTGQPGRGAQMWSIRNLSLLRSFECGGRRTTGYLSEDGRRLVTRTDSEDSSRMTLRLWPLPDGEPIKLGEMPLDGEPDIDPTGAWMAYPTETEIRMLSLEHLEDRSSAPIARHDHRIANVAFDQQGNRVAAIDESGEIRLWSVASPRPRPLRTIQSSSGGPVVFNLDGSLLAAIGGSRVSRWNLESHQEAAPLELGFGGSVLGVAFDPLGRWIAATGMAWAQLWPLGHRYPSVMAGHDSKPMLVTYALDGSWVASASWDGTVRLWPTSSTNGIRARVLLSAEGKEARFFSLAAASDGQFLVAGTASGEIWIIPINGRGPQLLGRMNDFVQAVAVSPDSRTVATGGGYFDQAEQVIRLWDVDSGDQRILDPGDEGSVTDLEFMGDGSLLSVSGGTLRRWNLENGDCEVLEKSGVRRFDLSADDTSVLVNFGEAWSAGPIRSLSLVDGQWQDLPGFGESVRSVALDTTGTVAVAGTMDGTVRVGLIDDKDPHILFAPDLADPWGVSVSPDGHWIAVGGADGAVRLWPMPDLSKPPLHTLPHDELVAKLKTLTNLRVVRDPESSTGWTLTHDPFPGWETVPSW